MLAMEGAKLLPRSHLVIRKERFSASSWAGLVKKDLDEAYDEESDYGRW